MIQDQFNNFLKSAQRKTIEHDGVTWEYFVNGSGTETLLILTGGGSVAESAFQYIDELSKNYKVITPNIPEVNTVQECLDGILAILKNENVDLTNILGFSMGGMIAQCFVRKYPSLVNKLVLFVSMLPSKEYAKKYAKYKKGISIVPEFLFRLLSKYSLKKQVLQDKQQADAVTINFWLSFFRWEFDSRKMNKKLLLATSNILIDYFSNYQFTQDDLRNWPGELLLIEGDKDKVITQNERNKFTNLYPQAQIITLQNSGHFGEGLLNPEKPLEFIKSFLAS